MGLDQPIYVQYVTWAGRALQGDLGRSVRQSNQPVAEAVMQRLPVTSGWRSSPPCSRSRWL